MAAVKVGAKGFSLVELLVAMAVLSVIALGCAALIVQSTRLLDRAGRSLQDPSWALAAAHLRHDVHQAAGLVTPMAVWTSTTLELRGQDGSLIRIEPWGQRLVRVVHSPSGREVSRRALLAGVRRWRWRAVTSDLVEIELDVSQAADPWREARRAGSSEGPSSVEAKEKLRLALRGSREGRSW